MNDKTQTISATWRLPLDLLDRLRRQAEIEERSMTTLVRRALQRYLAAEGERKEEAQDGPDGA